MPKTLTDIQVDKIEVDTHVLRIQVLVVPSLVGWGICVGLVWCLTMLWWVAALGVSCSL